MKFENDKVFLLLRTGFLILWIIAILIFMFTIRDLKYAILLISTLAIFLIISILVMYLMVNSIKKVEDVIIIKNIFGIAIKQINLSQILGRKIIYKQIPYNGIGIMKIVGLTENKYEKFIQVKLDLENGKKYNFNGQILTLEGLQKFNNTIKK